MHELFLMHIYVSGKKKILKLFILSHKQIKITALNMKGEEQFMVRTYYFITSDKKQMTQ